ncbi:MAG: pseudouridine synthase [Xanthomonadales bacterium]|nr:pseudouridine synthase [Xanthomonadales bacterium]
MLIALHKPYGVLSQFTDRAEPPRRTLAEFGLPPGVWPAGRLDLDSEGLLLLSDEGALIREITDPRRHWPKTYLVQVEGEIGEEALERLRRGVLLRDGRTRPAEARRLSGPPPWLGPRDPPVRFRRSVPDCWIELVLREGRNRQVRRMTAAVGHPTLRLVRIAVGPYRLEGLPPGGWRFLTPPSPAWRPGPAGAARRARG